jgi:hypothetical protein
MVSPLCEGVFLYDDALSHDDNIRTLYQDTLARHFCKAFSQGAFGPFDGWAFDGSHSGDNDCFSSIPPNLWPNREIHLENMATQQLFAAGGNHCHGG